MFVESVVKDNDIQKKRKVREDDVTSKSFAASLQHTGFLCVAARSMKKNYVVHTFSSHAVLLASVKG